MRSAIWQSDISSWNPWPILLYRVLPERVAFAVSRNAIDRSLGLFFGVAPLFLGDWVVEGGLNFYGFGRRSMDRQAGIWIRFAWRYCLDFLSGMISNKSYLPDFLNSFNPQAFNFDGD